ncbi:potassium transporter 1 [Tanacetum coccineum]|uniref:Potassium transporter 1 n=1 Tax=Tanacetum coccineum TaxID=301880 RepID=A0ABQ5FIQ8_9ASTR
MFHQRPSSSFESQEYGIHNQKLNKASCSAVLSLAYQSLGVVYGDLSTSPLYVYKTTFSGKLSLHEDDEEIYGVLSFIFWTFTLIALLKYVLIVMSADDNGEGGTFALYSLLCRHAKLSMLPNQQENDEKLSAYGVEKTAETWQSFALKSFFEKHIMFRKGLLIFVLLGTCMTIGDGVFTPAISDDDPLLNLPILFSVLSAVSGVTVKVTGLHENYVVAISCVLLVGLFSIQHHGTHRVAFLFAPVVTAWLLSIAGIGIYNIIKWNPRIFQALSPIYMVKLLKETRREGWLSLGGVVLSITGVETMFADLGHFSTLSVKIAFTFLVYPCLVLAYLGEAAFLSRHHEDIQRSFYKAIPGKKSCILARVHSCYVCSCRRKSGCNFCHLFDYKSVLCIELFPSCENRSYFKKNIWAGVYSGGLAVTTVMFVTTCLMTMVIIIVWKKHLVTAALFLVLFGSVELLYLSAGIFKVPEGGWIPLLLSLTIMSVMFIWNYGKLKKHEFDLENKVSMNRILSLGPSLGMVRVPGIGLVYTNLVTGIPAIFGHFVTNLPAFHQVLVFVCVKSVQVPYVQPEERMIIGRVGPREYHMFRCIVRYGYKDVPHENYNFENGLVSALVEYVETEGKEKNEFGDTDTESESLVENFPEHTFTLPDYEEKMVRSIKEIEESFGGCLDTHSNLKDESIQILKARESGIAYILGHSYARAKKSSSLFSKFAIDVVYSFLSRNCRGTDVVLNVPHTSLLEVGMIYYV